MTTHDHHHSQIDQHQQSEKYLSHYTCPMHPEIRQQEPGDCPIYGMALELRTLTSEEDPSELKSTTRRFWVSLAPVIPVFILATTHD